MNNSVFGKIMKNVRNHRDIKLVATNKKRCKLVSEHNYHTAKWFSERLIAIKMKKIKVKMGKPIYLGLSILELSKTVMYEFWYDYIKPKYQNNAKLCYMDTDSFIINIKTDDYECNRPLSTGKNKKVTELMKDEIEENSMTEFVALRPKTYSYLMNDDIEVKKAKGTKMCVIKKTLKLNIYKNWLLNNEVILKSQ